MPAHPAEAENAAEAAAAQALREAGYPLVLREVPKRDQRTRVDVVAYAPTADGGLRATVAVEVKSKHLGSQRSRDDALDQLAGARHRLGTRLHYVANEDGWWEADSGLRKLHQVPGPARNEAPGPGRLTDPLLVEHLLTQQFWRFADRHRGERSVADSLRALVEVLAEQRSIQAGDVQVPAEDGLLWAAARELGMRVLSELRATEWTSDQTIAGAMATLAGTDGHLYLDPFCGVGSLLWHAADRLQELGWAAELQGLEINADVVSNAQAFARLCPVPLSIARGDAFQQTFSTAADDGATFTADRVLTQPPLGLRLTQPYTLSSGEDTTDGDLASLDVCLRALRPGGRAVLQHSRGWTFRSGPSLRYRQFLAQTVRVAAIVGLPSGALRGTGVPSVLTVIEKSAPGETFIAQLEQDWPQQLSDDGDVMRALLAHLDAPAEASGLL